MREPVVDWSSVPVVLTVEEAASILKKGRSAAYDAVRHGEIPAVRIGRSLRVPREALQRMLAKAQERGEE